MRKHVAWSNVNFRLPTPKVRFWVDTLYWGTWTHGIHLGMYLKPQWALQYNSRTVPQLRSSGSSGPTPSPDIGYPDSKYD